MNESQLMDATSKYDLNRAIGAELIFKLSVLEQRPASGRPRGHQVGALGTSGCLIAVCGANIDWLVGGD